MTNLPILTGFQTMTASAINNRGEIVGVSRFQDPVNLDFVLSKAVLWRDGAVIDLNTLVPAGLLPVGSVHPQAAAHINDVGQIVVNAFDQHYYRTYLLTPK